jgi:hypothetical protein
MLDVFLPLGRKPHRKRLAPSLVAGHMATVARSSAERRDRVTLPRRSVIRRFLEPALDAGVLSMELAGLEPATSWVRYELKAGLAA